MTEKNIHTALCAAQAEIENPPKEKEANVGKYSYKYADISDVLKSVLPVLTRHGISVSQAPRIEDGSMILKTALAHGESNTSIECDYPVCSLNGDHQKMGGALTYARRYALCTMVGVAPADDLDGADAAKSGDGDRPQLSADAAKKEINWDAIIERIRKAPSQDKLDSAQQYVTSNKGYWPNSFVSSATEEIMSRRAELEMQGRASGYSEPADAISDCLSIDEVLKMEDALIQLGNDEAYVRELADTQKAAIKANSDLFNE